MKWSETGRTYKKRWKGISVYLSWAGKAKEGGYYHPKRTVSREEKRVFSLLQGLVTQCDRRNFERQIQVKQKKMLLMMSFVKLKRFPTGSSGSPSSQLVCMTGRGRTFLCFRKGRRWLWGGRASTEWWTGLPGSLSSSFLPARNNSLCLLLILCAIRRLNLTIVTKENSCPSVCAGN